MKLKTVEIEGTTYAVVQDGHPVYEDGGKDVPFKAEEAKTKIKTQAGALDAAERERDAAQRDLGKWSKLGELDEVRKAVATVGALGEKGIDPDNAAVKLAEAQAEAASLRETVSDREATIEGLRKSNFDLSFGSQVKGSPWIKENMLDGFDSDRDAVVEMYGRYVKPSENGGGPVYLDRDGNPLKIEGNDPTLEQFLDHHVRKAYRRPSGAEGSGDTGGKPTGGSGGAPKHKGDFKNDTERIAWMGANEGKYETLPMDPKHLPPEKPPQPGL